MKLSILHDGFGRPKVVNADTGEILEGVESVNWKMAKGGQVTVTLKLFGVRAMIKTKTPQSLQLRFDDTENEEARVQVFSLTETEKR